jgi:hypothetical protein
MLKLGSLTLAVLVATLLPAQTTVHSPTGSPPDQGVYTTAFPSESSISATYIDDSGNAYIGGSTTVALAATAGAAFPDFQACAAIIPTRLTLGRPACSWAFIAKLSPAGVLIFLTYLPEPNGFTAITAITADRTGNIYVAGDTRVIEQLPPKFPVTPGAYLKVPANPALAHFIAKLNSAGSALLYATYFDKINLISSLLPDAQGNLYAGMETDTLEQLPSIHPIVGTARSAGSGYLAKLDTTGSSLLLATAVSVPAAIAGIGAMSIDSAGDLYISSGCRFESSAGGPCVPVTAGALQSVMKGPTGWFVMKIHPDGVVVFSTLLPWSGLGGSVRIALDANRNIVFAGGISAPDQQDPIQFSGTPGAFQTTFAETVRGQTSDGFIAKLDSSGSKLLFFTFFAGSLFDSITGYALIPNGDVVFSGLSYSPDLPMTSDAWNPCHPAANLNDATGPSSDFVGRISSDGSRLLMSSFVGPGYVPPFGQPGQQLNLAGADASGDLYLVGRVAAQPAIMRYHPVLRPKGSAACISNATHGYGTDLAPGAFTTVRGNAIAGTRSMRTTLAPSGTLPTIFQGLQVLIENKPAPLLESCRIASPW